MYFTYLRRELSGRTKQTVIVSAGLAIAIALVIIVNALTAGVRDAQTQALESVYGVGTDLTVAGAQQEPDERDDSRFEFDQDGGATADDGSTTLAQSQLRTEMGRGTLAAATISTISAIGGVSSATGALSLTNSTFSGELPQTTDGGTSTEGEAGTPPADGDQQGGGGFGGGSFDVESFTVLGVDPAVQAVGPLSSVTASEGRALDTGDAGQNVAVLDATYATTNDLAVGGTVDVGGTTMEIVGIVSSSSSDTDTASNIYIPLDVAQSLAGVGDVVSTVYVQATSADGIATVRDEIETALPDATVSSQSDLASTVSGSLSSATSLITSLGTWLSILVLAVAVVLAVLFTMSGVSRRTREFGTLKAIGWSNGRVIGQIAGESMVQGLIGGAIGLAIGLGGILAINVIAPTISSATAATEAGTSGRPGAGGPGFASAAQTATDITLSAPLTPWVLVAAVGLAVSAGLVAGAFGGWRAARLSPAEALRSVA
ncbi:ABC transporter permease [Labedella endophytica]|uniref:ABC transporter permease n=1 Tax=Labedella endophytica TaxID=1523160 RepID=A0A433JS91_9MICO|nr:ABC transporter permease [Labedella endophytica]RUR01186.1 ABC transporter permease [Labedella endophytica]